MRAKCWNEASPKKMPSGNMTCKRHQWRLGVSVWAYYPECKDCTWHGYEGKWLAKTIRERK